MRRLCTWKDGTVSQTNGSRWIDPHTFVRAHSGRIDRKVPLFRHFYRRRNMMVSHRVSAWQEWGLRRVREAQEIENSLNWKIVLSGNYWICQLVWSVIQENRDTAPHDHTQQSGTKRKNRSEVEIARRLLLQSNLPQSFWAEAISTANYIRNRCSTNKYTVLVGKYSDLRWFLRIMMHIIQFGR